MAQRNNGLISMKKCRKRCLLIWLPPKLFGCLSMFPLANSKRWNQEMVGECSPIAHNPYSIGQNLSMTWYQWILITLISGDFHSKLINNLSDFEVTPLRSPFETSSDQHWNHKHCQHCFNPSNQPAQDSTSTWANPWTKLWKINNAVKMCELL